MRRLLIIPLLAVATFGQSVPVISPIPWSAWKLGAGSTIKQLPDGTSVLEVGYGSSASVDLGVTPQQVQSYTPNQAPYINEGDYRLKFEVINSLSKYPGYYQLEVDFGTQELCPAEGWARVNFSAVTVVCPGPAYIVIDQALPGGGPVQGQHNLVINVTSPGWPVQFKPVSLTFTPTN